MVVAFEDLPKIRQQHAGKTIVLGSGVFDLLHCGHLDYLQGLKRYGDIVVAMVKSDARVHAGKGPKRPVLPQHDRVRMVSAVKGVDYAFVAPHHAFIKNAPDPTYVAVFEALCPDAFHSTNPVWRQLDGLGVSKVIITKRPTKVALRSTTDIIKHVQGL